VSGPPFLPSARPRTFDPLEGPVTAIRKAHARRTGSLKEGKGSVDFGDGLFEGAYSFTSRLEEGPAPILKSCGAVHVSYFALALALALGRVGVTPDYVDATRPRHGDATE
jgi:osmotically inducible protein OsmC